MAVKEKAGTGVGIGTILPIYSGGSVGYLEGPFGEAFLEEFRERVLNDYNCNPALDVLSYAKGVVTGSNNFAVVLANQILEQEGLRTATQADLEKALQTGALPFEQTIRNTGLVLRSEKDKYHKNTLLAGNLAEQVRARGIRFSPENPIMIPLIGFKLENAKNDYGLIFKLREDAEVYEAPVLSKDGTFNSEDINEETGLPRNTRSVEGNRALYTTDSGLSSFCMYKGVLNTYLRDLKYSEDHGRIVVVEDSFT